MKTEDLDVIGPFPEGGTLPKVKKNGRERKKDQEINK